MSPIQRLSRLVSLSLCAACLTLVACSRAPDPAADGEYRVLVSIPPLQGLVRELVPEGAEVDTLVPAGVSVHAFQLRPDDRARVARADLVVMVGLGLEEGATKVLESGGGALIRFNEAVGVQGASGHAHHHHGDEPCEFCGNAGVDPHLWLDPELVLGLIDAIEAELNNAKVGDSATINERVLALKARVSALDEEFKSRLADRAGQAIVTHHNAWPRLADRYNLRVAAVLRPVAAGEPTPAELAKAKEVILNEGVETIFIEPQFDASLAQRLAENAGVSLGQLDPIGDGDWFKMMRANLDVLVDGIPATELATEPEPEGP